VVRLADQLTKAAPEIELAWSLSLDERSVAGWPSSTPEGDRKPRTGPPDTDPDALDYSDPTGELAYHLERLDADLFRLQDILLEMAKMTREAQVIAGRHLSVGAPALPACSVSNCSSPVESYHAGNSLAYRGMEQIAGQWVAKPGARPVCGRHRKRSERA